MDAQVTSEVVRDTDTHLLTNLSLEEDAGLSELLETDHFIVKCSMKLSGGDE